MKYLRRYILRSQTAIDAKAIRADMRAAMEDPEYSTPTTREFARYRWQQEWQGRHIHRAS